MASVDLLDGFTFGPSTPQNSNEYFLQNFWGEKNQGFDVLYHNMKHGQISVKSLQDFIRESAVSEDMHAKHLTKLAKQAVNSNPLGTFAPMFELFKGMAEKLSSCHMDVVSKLHDVLKDLSKYSDEQKGKHKQIKDELSSTADAFHQIENTKLAVQKTKEKYHQLCLEVEKLRKASAPAKEIEKAEGKSKKASEDYRNLVKKYANVRKDYEQKMSVSAKRFQDVEVAHLNYLKTILESYILAYENANMLKGQVHQEFRKQIAENTTDILLKQYSESKGTGTEKPGAILFEECDLNSTLISVEPVQTNGVHGDESPTTTSQAPSKTTKRPISLPFRRRKPRKPAKEAVNGTAAKEAEKESESIESLEKDNISKIDEEGYTIRPETPKGSRSSWGYDSSDDSDSDSDDFPRKIRVNIKPVEEVNLKATSESNLDTLSAITKNLTISSPTTVGARRLARRSSNHSIGDVATARQVVSAHSSDPSKKFSSSQVQDSPVSLTPSPTPASATKEAKALPAPSIPPRSPTTSVVPITPTTPVPLPRSSIKGDLNKLNKSRRLEVINSSNRFSTAFVEFDVKSLRSYGKDNRGGIEGSPTKQLQVGRSNMESDEDSGSRGRSPTTPSPAHRSASPRISIANPSPYSSSENLLLPFVLPSPSTSPTVRPRHSASLSQCNTPSKSLIDTDIDRKARASSATTSPMFLPKLPSRRHPPHSTGSSKLTSPQTPSTAKRSSADELFDLFGNSNSTSTASIPNAAFSANFADFTNGKKDAGGPPKMSQSNSTVSLDVLSMSNADKGRKEEMSFLAMKTGSPAPNTLRSIRSTPVLRPNNLAVAKDPTKAPLATSDSLSSLSSTGGTPVEGGLSFSRGPSPFTSTLARPFPIAVAIKETVNALSKGFTFERCIAKVCGQLLVSFPAAVIRSLVANPNQPVLSFRFKTPTSAFTCSPDLSLLVADTPNEGSNARAFAFNMQSLTRHIQKMVESDPDAIFYNVQVLSYEFISKSGVSLVPLHLTSSWTCDVDSTDVTIDYKLNDRISSASLEKVVVRLLINGGVTKAQSVPAAEWFKEENHLIWKLGSLSGDKSSGRLKSKLSLSAGPSTSMNVAAHFSSEGSTLTGCGFELVGSDYNLQLNKKTYISGKYLLNGL